MSTRRENTTLKMPGLLNTNEHHNCRTQTPDVEEEDDAYGWNAARRTKVKLFWNQQPLHAKKTKGRRTRLRWGQGWGRRPKPLHASKKKKNGEGSRGRRRPTREGGKERDEPFIFKIKKIKPGVQRYFCVNCWVHQQKCWVHLAALASVQTWDQHKGYPVHESTSKFLFVGSECYALVPKKLSNISYTPF